MQTSDATKQSRSTKLAMPENMNPVKPELTNSFTNINETHQSLSEMQNHTIKFKK